MKSSEFFLEKVKGLTQKETEVSKLEKLFLESKSLLISFYEIYLRENIGYNVLPINMNFVDGFDVDYEITIADHQISKKGESVITILPHFKKRKKLWKKKK